MSSTSIAFLEAELNRMNTEFELILNKEGPRDKMIEMEQAKLQQATKEVEEEFRKAKAEASAIESRINVTLSEIEAAKTSKIWGNLDFSNGVTLPFEEYYALSKKAKELEDQAKEKIISATEQMEAAKEKAEEERLLMEHELTHNEEHEHESTTNVGNFDDFVNIGTDRETTNSDTTYNSNTATGLKRRKRMFFAKIVMFFAGKKIQSLQ